MLMQYMYLEAEVSLIGTFVLAMVVKEIIVGTTCILSVSYTHLDVYKRQE